MKKAILVSMIGACVAANSARADFGAGDLAVVQVGDGSAALSSAGTDFFIDDYTTSGILENSFPVLSTGTDALVVSGSATSEGALSLSPDGSELAFAGYNAPAGTKSVASSTSAAVPRGYGTIDATGTYSFQGDTTTQYSGNNVRSATTDGNGNFWLGGTPSGTYYAGNTTTAATVQSAVSNIRVVADENGTLYFSTGSGSARGIYAFTGAPTGAATAVNIINTGASSSPYAFAINSSATIAYVADDDAYTSSTGLGGIERWDFVSGAWVFEYTLQPEDSGTSGARGLTVNFSGADPVIFGTTTEASGNSIFEITDDGASSAAETLATAGANEVFRGIAFAPEVPEPGTLALMGLGMAGGLMLRRRRQ